MVITEDFVQTFVHLEPNPFHLQELETSGGGNRNWSTYRFLADSMHPTGMLSCLLLWKDHIKIAFYITIILMILVIQLSFKTCQNCTFRTFSVDRLRRNASFNISWQRSWFDNYFYWSFKLKNKSELVKIKKCHTKRNCFSSTTFINRFKCKGWLCTFPKCVA